MIDAPTLPRLLRRTAAAAALALFTAACGEGGDSDDGEMKGDPSTQQTGSQVRPDSTTNVGDSPAPGATATSQGIPASPTATTTATPTARPDTGTRRPR
jgi:hypothetical protein